MNPLSGIANKLVGGTKEFAKEELKNIRDLPKRQAEQFRANMAAMPRSFIASAFSESPGVGGFVLNWYDSVSGFGGGNRQSTGSGKTPEDPESRQAKTPIEKLDLVARRQKQTNTTLERISSTLQQQYNLQKKSNEDMMRSTLAQIRAAQEAAESNKSKTASFPSNIDPTKITSPSDLLSGGLGVPSFGMMGLVGNVLLKSLGLGSAAYGGFRVGSEIYDNYLGKNEDFQKIMDSFFVKLDSFFDNKPTSNPSDNTSPSKTPSSGTTTTGQLTRLKQMANFIGSKLNPRSGGFTGGSRSLGGLARIIESSGKYGEINPDDFQNSRSYGAYQFNVKTRGSPKGSKLYEFLVYAKENGIDLIDHLPADPKTKKDWEDFDNAFQETLNGPQGTLFKQLQDDFAKQKVFTPALKKYTEVIGDASPGPMMQEMIFALGEKPVPESFWERVKKQHGSNWDSMSDYKKAMETAKTYKDSADIVFPTMFNESQFGANKAKITTLNEFNKQTSFLNEMNQLEEQRKDSQKTPTVVTIPTPVPSSGGGSSTTITNIDQRAMPTKDHTINRKAGSINEMGGA